MPIVVLSASRCQQVRSLTVKNVLGCLVLGAVISSIWGCGPKKSDTVYEPPSETSYSAEPTNPDEAVATQLREGSVQMAAASDSLASALQEAKRVSSSLKGDAHEAAQDIVDFLDDAGESIAEAAADPPSEAEVKKDFASADDLRKKRIQDGNEAYKSIEQALGTLEGLRAGIDGLQTLGDLITLTLDDLGDAIEALGGKVESEEEPDPASHSPSKDQPAPTSR